MKRLAGPSDGVLTYFAMKVGLPIGGADGASEPTLVFTNLDGTPVEPKTFSNHRYGCCAHSGSGRVASTARRTPSSV